MGSATLAEVLDRPKTTTPRARKVNTIHYDRPGLRPYLEKLGFYLPAMAAPPASATLGHARGNPKAVNDNDLSVTAVLVRQPGTSRAVSTQTKI